MSDPALVLVGYLVTHADGWQVRMAPDKARADLYAAKQHAVIEPLFVLRAAANSLDAGADAGAMRERLPETHHFS